MTNWLKYPFVLLIISIVSAIILSGVNQLTKSKDKIIFNDEVMKNTKLVLPEAVNFKKENKCVVGLDNKNEVIGYISIAESEGYADKIRLMVGVDKDFKIKGVKILYQNETQGIGTKVFEIESQNSSADVLPDDKNNQNVPWFIGQFIGNVMPFFTKDEGGNIDAVTGATVTSKAVCKAVNSAVENIKKCSGANENQNLKSK